MRRGWRRKPNGTTNSDRRQVGALPRDVFRVAAILHHSTGVDYEDALSFAAEAWWEQPNHPGRAWVRARNRCIDEQRHRHGDTRHRAPRTLMPLSAAPDVGAEDPNLAQVETRVCLADVLADLPDDELAALARAYWLHIPSPRNGPARVVHMRALRHARRAMNAQQTIDEEAPA